MTKEEAKRDLLYMLDELDKEHICLYYSVSRNEVIEYIDYILECYDYENIYDFYYIVSLVIKKISGIYDQHIGASYNFKTRLPFIFRIYDEEMYVISVVDGFEEYKFAKLTHVNDVDVNRIMDELEASITYNTDNLRKVRLCALTLEKFLTLPSIDSESKEITFKFISEDGEELEYTQDFETTFKPSDYDLKTKDNFNLEKINNSLLLTYNSCNKTEEEFNELLEQIDRYRSVKEIDAFIVDLRRNGGGNSTPFKILTKYLKDNNIRNYTLVDRYDFSSGVINAYEMQFIGSTIVGEPVGESITCFGNLCRDRIKLPNSGIQVTGTFKFFYPSENGFCYVKTKNDFKRLDPKYKEMKYLENDVVINYTLEDFKNEKDRILEYVLEDIKKTQ